jgi:hypothetical protein
MAILDDIFDTAAVFTDTADPQKAQVLWHLCTASYQSLLRRLRSGVSEDDCRDALVCAAAWSALAALDAGDHADGVSQFTAGDLSVRRENGAAGCLQVQAELLMAPYLKDSFSFRGVKA